MTTMKDVAELAGVSLITVSRVINSPDIVSQDTRIKVEKAMNELDFVPNFAAKALAQKSTRTIYLYIPKNISISDPFIMHLLSGVSEELSNANYLLLIKRELEISHHCDGVIITGLDPDEEIKLSSLSKIPFVLFGKSELDIDCIDIDNELGAEMMVDKLIDNGHKRISFIMLNTAQRFAQERFSGYKKALQKNNIAYEERLVRFVENSEQDAYVKALDLLTNEKTTAVFCCVDLLAIGAFRAADKLKLKIPKHLSVVGYDGLIFDLIPKVQLTTMKQPVYEAGRALAARLLERLKRPELALEKKYITPELIWRKSAGHVKE